MKKILYLIIVIVVGFSYSCKEMDRTYEEYIVADGLVYPQRADSLKVYSGFYKARITWLKAKDPNVVKARIYWNNYTDSIDVSIPADRDVVSVDINNLLENTYTFYVITYDNEGNESIPTEVTGTVFGDNYVLSLAIRPITSDAISVLGAWKITWGNASVRDGAISTELEYQKRDGTKNTITIPSSEPITTISDVEPGTEYRYRTIYFIPDKFLETIYTDYSTSTAPIIEEIMIPVDRFRNAALPGDYYTAYNGSFPLEKAWDRSGGLYATAILSPPLAPQHFTIDIGRTVIINRFKMYPRSGNSELYRDAGPRLVEVWGSMDPPSDGSWDNWYKLGGWEQLKPSGYG
ncbi:MAG: hypothetical protein LBT50_02630, partial [Prevotellaceae bacterium]|nr:hypothetical protein [Prevotellaceae bacterium]